MDVFKFGFYTIFALIVLGFPVLGVVKPELFSAIRIGPIILYGPLGIRIGCSILLVAAVCFCVSIVELPRLPRLRLPRRSNNRPTANESERLLA
jgi:hypothetical protein